MQAGNGAESATKTGSNIPRSFRPGQPLRVRQAEREWQGSASNSSHFATLFAPVFRSPSSEISEHSARLFELANVGPVANLEDRFWEQWPAFSRCLSARVEQAEQRETHRPNFGE